MSESNCALPGREALAVLAVADHGPAVGHEGRARPGAGPRRGRPAAPPAARSSSARPRRAGRRARAAKRASNGAVSTRRPSTHTSPSAGPPGRDEEAADQRVLHARARRTRPAAARAPGSATTVGGDEGARVDGDVHGRLRPRTEGDPPGPEIASERRGEAHAPSFGRIAVAIPAQRPRIGSLGVGPAAAVAAPCRGCDAGLRGSVHDQVSLPRALFSEARRGPSTDGAGRGGPWLVAMASSRVLAPALALAAGYALSLRPRMLRWGATDEEVRRPYPGAELIPGGARSATMAVTIDAPPSRVWPWLVQMGTDRAGWYSWDRLDNFGRRERRPHPSRVAARSLSATAWPRSPTGASGGRSRRSSRERFLGLRMSLDLRGPPVRPARDRGRASTPTRSGASCWRSCRVAAPGSWSAATGASGRGGCSPS